MNDSFSFWQGQKDLVSPAASVGASASQRSPPETRAPRHAVLEHKYFSSKKLDLSMFFRCLFISDTNLTQILVLIPLITNKNNTNSAYRLVLKQVEYTVPL